VRLAIDANTVTDKIEKYAGCPAGVVERWPCGDTRELDSSSENVAERMQFTDYHFLRN